MFTQPCFIRKNNKELYNKLENLGMNLINSNNTTLDCHNYDGKGSHRNIEEGNVIITYYSNHYGVVYDIDSFTKRNRIDCGTNEDLFLAIAALRDDTDKNQWFIWNVTDYDVKHTYEWILCTEDKIEDMLFYDCQWRKTRKATVEELFNHFNK